MLADAIAIAAHFEAFDCSTGVELPTHGDIDDCGPCVQMHFQRNGRGTVVEIVVHAGGVTLFRHVHGRIGPATPVRNTAPHMVAELVIGISG